MTLTTIVMWAFLILLVAIDFTGVAITIVILWAGIRLLDFAGTDPLVLEDRKRQIRHEGKTHLQRTEESLNKAEKAMKAGKADLALEIVEEAEVFLKQNVGPLDIAQAEERELIRDFREKFNSKLKGQ